MPVKREKQSSEYQCHYRNRRDTSSASPIEDKCRGEQQYEASCEPRSKRMKAPTLHTPKARGCASRRDSKNEGKIPEPTWNEINLTGEHDERVTETGDC